VPVRSFIYRTVAQIDYSLCVKCGLCAKACPTSAIKWAPRSYPSIDLKLCTGCSICIQSCPKGAIRMVRKASVLPVAIAVALIVLLAASVYAMIWAQNASPGSTVEYSQVREVGGSYEAYKDIIWQGSSKGGEKEPLAAPSGG